jgi:hypothetical protein
MPAATAPAPTAPTAVEKSQDLVLTPEQHRFFDTFGYLRLPGLIADRIGRVIDAFEGVWAARGGGHNGKPHDGTARSCIVPFIDQSEELSSLIDDPRIHGLACSLLGDDFNYMGSDGNYYVGDTGWHPDGAHPVQRFIKIAFYLDQLDGSNGALRVIPGSHHLDCAYRRLIDENVRDSHGRLGLHGSQIPADALAVTPGDILVFNHNTYHSAWNGGKRRRMFTMNCCQRYPQDKLKDLQQYLSGHARFFIERNVGPEMLRNATPGRMRHLQQVMENDFLIAPKAAELRAQRQESARG